MAEPFNDTDAVRKSYFINDSERSVDPTEDEGKLVQLESDGRFSTAFVKRWDLISTTTLASDAASVSFTDLSDYQEIFLIARPNLIRNDATSTAFRAQVSVDNGANWLSTGAYATALPSEGTDIVLGAYADGLANIMLEFLFFNTPIPLKPVNVGFDTNFRHAVVTSDPLNAFRVFFVPTAGNHRFESGSVFYLYGHK